MLNPVAEVSSTRSQSIKDVGLARSDAEAGRRGDGCRRALSGRNRVRIVECARLIVVGERNLTPAKQLERAAILVQKVICHAVVRCGGRVSIATDQSPPALQPIDVGRQNFIQLLVFTEGVDVQAVVKQVLAGQHRNALRILAAVVELRPAGIDFQALEVFAQLEVQHTGNGVRTIDGRRAARDDFNALDQQTRNGVDVDCQGALRGSDVAAAVNQRQRTARAQRAQVRQRQAARVQNACGRVRRNLRVHQRRDGRQIVDDRVLTGRQQGFAADLDQGGGSRDRIATDTRTSDDDFVNLSSVCGFSGGLLRLGPSGGRHGENARQNRRPEQIITLQFHNQSPH